MPAGHSPHAADGAALDLRSVTKVYRGSTTVAALSDVSLRVEHGTSLALIGPSGSGKSTLLNIAGGLDVPTSGTVLVDETDVGQMTERARSVWRRSHVAYIFQAYHLLPSLTCEQNVALPLHLQGLRRSEVAERAAAALADVGLAPRARHVPDELSGGERQRVAIARALVTRPKLLLADEPTGNLDSASGAQVLDMLLAVSRTRAATVVMVTHNAEAAGRCDRIVTMRDGRVETDDSA